MSRCRRRAIEFTESLNSFQSTNNDSEAAYSISQDSLNERTCESNSHRTEHSIILAGSSSKHNLPEDISMSSTAAFELRSVPDLNKCIDLFQEEQMSLKENTNKENNNPQYNVKGCEKQSHKIYNKSRTRDLILDSRDKLKVSTTKKHSKRDANYNIDKKKCNVISNSEKVLPKATSISEINSLYADANKQEKMFEIDSGDKCTSDEKKNFQTILCSLDNELNQMKEVLQSQRIFKRLSDQFIHAPNNFTEKLLTIIEESVINNGDDVYNASAIDLSRLTTEFRKMCKFIEDETAPVWPASPLGTPPCENEIVKPPTCNKLEKTPKNENSVQINTSTYTPTTPISGVDILRKRFFNKILTNNSNKSMDNGQGESTNMTFELLEAECERLYPKEKECSKLLRRSLSTPSLLSMSHFENICEQQMVSLSTSNNDESHEASSILHSANLSDSCLEQNMLNSESKFKCPKPTQFQNYLNNVHYDSMSYSMKKSKKMSEKADASNTEVDKITNTYSSLDPDDLEKTLLQDIAEKRKRCLDTARLITEINADPEAVEAHKTLKLSPMFTEDNDLHSLSQDETKFLQTLMSCKDYQMYLEKKKPLFKLFQNAHLSTPETNSKSEEIKYLQKEVISPKKTPDTPRSSASATKAKSNTKQKLFVTPGKTPATRKHKKKIYFPSMHSPKKTTVEKHILKSPHEQGLYRLNYNTIISPVGMYINATDMQLIKNVRAKSGRLFHTPESDAKTSSTNLKQNTPMKGIIKSQEKAAFKFNLSPKVPDKKTPENGNTPKSHFILPKVSYDLPTQVKTINKQMPIKHGSRVKKLMESAQSKVIIRHEGRANTVQKEIDSTNGEVYSINYRPEDESIHVEQAASKTNFIGKRKEI